MTKEDEGGRGKEETHWEEGTGREEGQRSRDKGAVVDFTGGGADFVCSLKNSEKFCCAGNFRIPRGANFGSVVLVPNFLNMFRNLKYVTSGIPISAL
jgi:hypothetical protein